MAQKNKEIIERNTAENLALIMARLLLDHRGWRVDSLMRRLNISKTTFYTYRQRLRGLPIRELRDKNGESLVHVVKDGNASYLRLRNLDEPPEGRDDFFTRMMSLQMAKETFRFLGDVDLRRHLDELVREFSDHIREKHYAFAHILRNMDRAFVVLPRAPKNYRGKRAVVQAILRGMEGPYRLKLTYENSRDEQWTRVIEPLTLVVYDSALYLLVRSTQGGHVYTLAVDRVIRVEKTGEVFRYPPASEYDPMDYTEGAFGMMTSDSGSVDVELIFANKSWLKKSLRERRWHRTQQFFELPDGRLHMTFNVSSMTSVWPWIRSYGDDVEVVKPERGDDGE